VGADVVGADVVGADVGAEVGAGTVGAAVGLVGADVGSLQNPSAAISSTEVFFMDFMMQQKTPPFAKSS